MLNVSIIIVNRNGKQITLDCLQSLRKEKVKEIILVDNASTDGTVPTIKKLVSSKKFLEFSLKPSKDKTHLQFILNKKNNGFAEANNQGYKIATGEYIVFLNNDTIVTRNFLQPLIKALQKKKRVAAVQPLILFPNKTIDSIGSYLTPTGFLFHRAHRQNPTKSLLKSAPVYTMKGACMVWKKEVLEKIGVFDESYFAYFEETDLCHRALNYGYEVEFIPESKITHFGGFTSNKMEPAFVQYHNAKNRLLTYCRHLPAHFLLRMLPLHLLLCEGLVLKTAASNIKTAWAIQKGIVIGLYRGIIERFRPLPQGYTRHTLKDVTKNPDISYYQALFSSLEGYQKVW